MTEQEIKDLKKKHDIIKELEKQIEYNTFCLTKICKENLRINAGRDAVLVLHPDDINDLKLFATFLYQRRIEIDKKKIQEL